MNEWIGVLNPFTPENIEAELFGEEFLWWGCCIYRGNWFKVYNGIFYLFFFLFVEFCWLLSCGEILTVDMYDVCSDVIDQMHRPNIILKYIC